MQWLSKARLIPLFCITLLLSLWTGNCLAQNLPQIQNQVNVNYKNIIGNNYYTESNIVITPLIIYGIDLWGIKQGPKDVVLGGIATYTITYGNSGTQTAYGVHLCDQFPAQMESVVYQNSGYFLSFDAINKLGTWNIDILPPGIYSFTMSIKIKEDAVGSSSLVNAMKIESPSAEIYLPNNYSTATTPIRMPDIDLWVQKQGPAFAIPGGIATYTITYGNYGSETAGNVILTDKFPDQMETVIQQTSGFPFVWDNLTKCGTWNLTNVTFGTYSFQLAIKIKANTQCPATMTNTMKIAYPGVETNYTNNQATATTLITDTDIEILKYGPQEAGPGQDIVYRIVCRNQGNTSAQGVKITDMLPQGLIYLSDTSGITPATTTNIITWEMGNLPAWDYRSFNIRVLVRDDVLASSTVTNIIEVSSTNPETNYTNNRASCSTHICLPEPNLKIRKWQSRDEVVAGQRMDYFVRYSNDGKGKAINTTITDYLPLGVSYLSDNNEWPYEITGNKIIWNVGTISPNTTKDFKLTVQVDKYVNAPTTTTNVIEITSQTYESTGSPGKDRWTCTTRVLEPIADVLIYKWGPDEVLCGSEFNYEITYNNNSANEANGVVIKDILDLQLTYGSDTTGIIPTFSSNEISWHIGTMTPWSSGNFLLRVSAPHSVGTLTNVIEITTLTLENNYNNNRATATTHVDKSKVDVGIEKIGSDARPGFIKKYDVTYYNNGTDKAQDVVIIDRLPKEVQYLSSNPAGNYNSAGHTITWNIGELLPQTKNYITIEVRIPVTQKCGVNLYNYIEIITTSPEYDNTNNNYTEIETVVGSIDPNDKLVSPQKYIQDNALLNYTIRFENQATATASAILITIEDQLSTNLDWTTMKFGHIKIGQGTTYTLENFDKDSLSCSYDVGNGTIRWEFDFKTGANGLPPNVIPPEGEGYVNFSVRARAQPGLLAGTEISNTATIRFDYNDPMETPPVTNIVDLDKPTSKVSSLAPYQSATSFAVSWSGTDTAGDKVGEIESYTVYVKDNDMPYTKWLNETRTVSGTFTGKTGHAYAFYSVAKDRAGNTETKTLTPEATTTLTLASHFVLATLLPTPEMYVGGALPLTVSIYDSEGNPVTDYKGIATLRDKLGIVGTATFAGTSSTWTGDVLIPQMPNGGTNTITVDAPGVSSTMSVSFLVLIDRYVGGTVTLFTSGVGTTTVRFGTGSFMQDFQDFYATIRATSTTNTPEGGIINSAREIRAYNMVHTQLTGTFTNLAYLEVPYPDANQDGFVDGTTIKEGTLRIYVWQNNQWEIINSGTGSTSGVDVNRNVVWCNINYLTTFMPMGILIAPANLGNVIVYPNPFKPNSGLGHEYITFGSKKDVSRKLTSSATIKIYTISGDLVKTLEVTPQDDGQKVWYANNDFGNKVASGVYIYMIINPQGEKCIGKLAIIR
ncbi:MAG: hypothetical protein ABIF11_07170 [Nitrospirota bacterium]